MTVTKFWHNPIIQVLITDEALGLRMEIEDFKKALKKELGVEVDVAIDKIIGVIKEESRKVV